jgi:hypothetical protein
MQVCGRRTPYSVGAALRGRPEPCLSGRAPTQGRSYNARPIAVERAATPLDMGSIARIVSMLPGTQ